MEELFCPTRFCPGKSQEALGVTKSRELEGLFCSQRPFYSKKLTVLVAGVCLVVLQRSQIPLSKLTLKTSHNGKFSS